MNRAVLSGVMMISSGLLWGCASAPSPTGLPDDATIEDSFFMGSWRAESGHTLLIEEGSGRGFEITVSDEGGARSYRGAFVRPDPARPVPFIVINLFSATPEKGARVPVYYYGAVRAEGDAFSVRAVRPEWLRSAAAGSADVKYVDVPEAPRSPGGVVVESPEVMRSLLSRALADPGAFAEPETYRRVR